MKGDIRKIEFQKIFLSPIVIPLIIIFLIFNTVIIFSQREKNVELGVLTEMVGRYGHEINEEVLANWEGEHERRLKEISEKLGRPIISATSFIENEGLLLLAEEEAQAIIETAILERYLAFALMIDEYYASIDVTRDMERNLAVRGFSGSLAETFRKHSENFQQRIDQVIENGEHLHFFFDGFHHQMHSFLFLEVLGFTIFSMTTISVLITSFLLSYEFDMKTYFLTYTTKCGRKLQIEKLKVALSSVSVITLGMLTIVLGIYFSVYDYSGLWTVPMSSAFLSEEFFFIVSSWNITFLQYLIGVIIVIWMTQLLFVLLIFCLSKFIKNGYFITILFAVIFGTVFITPGFLPANNNLAFYFGFNPFAMIAGPSALFLVVELSSFVTHYEVITIGVWSVLLIGGSWLCYQQFKKIDLN